MIHGATNSTRDVREVFIIEVLVPYLPTPGTKNAEETLKDKDQVSIGGWQVRQNCTMSASEIWKY